MDVGILGLALFIVATSLGAVLALVLWHSKRRRALASASLAVFSGLCIANEFASRAAHVDIRVDILFTIPLVSAGAIVIGLFAVRTSAHFARWIATALAAIGVISFSVFAVFAVATGRKEERLTATFTRARKLYSEETILCQENLAKRFGPLSPREDSCYGDLVVTSRSKGAYPYTRIIVNDNADAYLLFAPDQGIEDNIDLNDGPSARLVAGSESDLISAPNANTNAIRIKLRQTRAGTCEGHVDRYGSTSTLTLAKTVLPRCNVASAGPVHMVGAWGEISRPPYSPQYRRLTQIWLWEVDGDARALLLSNLAASGTQIPFQFALQLRGKRDAENRWELHRAGEDKYKSERPLLVTVEEGRARLSGPASLLRSDGELALEPAEVISHPKIALVPLRDRERFLAYFDNVLFNLNVPWTAP